MEKQDSRRIDAMQKEIDDLRLRVICLTNEVHGRGRDVDEELD